jgi:serine protease Do
MTGGKRLAMLAPVGLLLGLLLGAPAGAAEPELRTLVDQARAAGAEGQPVGKLSIAQATSRALLKDGDIDFKFSVDIDLGLDVKAGGLSEALTGPVEDTGRYAVVVNVALAKASRKIRDSKSEDSTKVVRTIDHQNPVYASAYKQFEKASLAWDKLSDRPRVSEAALARASRTLEEARAKLAATPPTLGQPVFGPYSFRVFDVDGSKALTVNYVVVDKVAKRYFKSVFDVVENQKFRLAKDIDRTDPNRDRIHVDHSFDKDIKDWEESPVLIRLSQLLEHAAGAEARPFASVTTLLDELGRDRNAAVARAEAEKYDARPLNDPRFDSVVAIYHAHGMGSGFYVRPSIVMTNYHVVEGNDIVELKRYDGRETFGQVIAKDVKLDLALVKVQDRGRPVSFYTGRDLPVGQPMEIIGHPGGYRFTITRGVISSVRRLKSLLTQDAPTDGHRINKYRDGVLYIQTDAAQNHGNSGGPWFVGDKVIGVADWGEYEPSPNQQDQARMAGLNFAVHYAEAQRFLNDALKGE